MGFRTGAYARVFDVKPKSGTMTSVRLAVTRKDKMTGEYVDEFSGWTSFIGSEVAKTAMSLKPGDRVKLGDVDVLTRFDKDKGISYITYKVFSYDVEHAFSSAFSAEENIAYQSRQTNEEDGNNDELPF